MILLTCLRDLWARFWARFWSGLELDELSITATRDRVRVFLSTTPPRFVVYMALLAGLSFGLLALCDRGVVGVPTATTNIHRVGGWREYRVECPSRGALSTSGPSGQRVLSDAGYAVS